MDPDIIEKINSRDFESPTGSIAHKVHLVVARTHAVSFLADERSFEQVNADFVVMSFLDMEFLIRVFIVFTVNKIAFPIVII